MFIEKFQDAMRRLSHFGRMATELRTAGHPGGQRSRFASLYEAAVAQQALIEAQQRQLDVVSNFFSEKYGPLCTPCKLMREAAVIQEPTFNDEPEDDDTTEESSDLKVSTEDEQSNAIDVVRQHLYDALHYNRDDVDIEPLTNFLVIKGSTRGRTSAIEDLFIRYGVKTKHVYADDMTPYLVVDTREVSKALASTTTNGRETITLYKESLLLVLKAMNPQCTEEQLREALAPLEVK